MTQPGQFWRVILTNSLINHFDSLKSPFKFVRAGLPPLHIMLTSDFAISCFELQRDSIIYKFTQNTDLCKYQVPDRWSVWSRPESFNKIERLKKLFQKVIILSRVAIILKKLIESRKRYNIVRRRTVIEDIDTINKTNLAIAKINLEKLYNKNQETDTGFEPY